VKEALCQYTVHIERLIKSLVVVADAFAALVVSFFILKISIEILWDTVREFTDTAPGSKVLDKIKHVTLSIDGLIDIHDLKVRISGGLSQMELHIVVHGGLTMAEGHRIARAVEHRLSGEIAEFGQITVHVDPLLQK
jgi:divalent metal cation (Fe/Co/Zn/Cd) transporter